MTILVKAHSREFLNLGKVCLDDSGVLVLEVAVEL